VAPEPVEESASLVDLMKLLEASVKAATDSKGEKPPVSVAEAKQERASRPARAEEESAAKPAAHGGGAGEGRGRGGGRGGQAGEAPQERVARRADRLRWQRTLGPRPPGSPSGRRSSAWAMSGRRAAASRRVEVESVRPRRRIERGSGFVAPHHDQAEVVAGHEVVHRDQGPDDPERAPQVARDVAASTGRKANRSQNAAVRDSVYRYSGRTASRAIAAAEIARPIPAAARAGMTATEAVAAAAAVDPDLRRCHDLAGVVGHEETAPVEVPRVELGSPDQRADRRGVGLGRGPDGGRLGRHARTLAGARASTRRTRCPTHTRGMPAAMPTLGLNLPYVEGSMDGATPRWTDIRAMAQAAESTGLHAVWVSDHLGFGDPDGDWSGAWESWTLLSAIAASTSRVRLGTYVTAVPLRNPALLAKMAETLDEVSAGRVILGLGAGWNEPEFRAFGLPFERRFDRFEEGLRIIASMFRTGRADLDGALAQARGARIEPRARDRPGRR
jgi:hypothetical protein